MARHLHRAFLRPAAIIGLIGLATPALAQFNTLYTFPSYGAGYFPIGGLAMDAAGALYGTTQYGGIYQNSACANCGTIYKLVPPAAGQTAWTRQLLHTFTLDPIQGHNEDGIRPVAPLTNFQNVFYGVASAAADTSCGCGNIFSITPSGTYTILHVFDPFVPAQMFSQWPNGSTPIGGLLIDTDGTMYGTTSSGGTGAAGIHNSNGAGIIYKISKTGGGFAKLHDFDGDLNGGPQGELIFGADGAIYGTTYGGGLYNEGVIFRMTKAGAYQVLYNFKGVNQPGGSHDGAQPQGRLALGPDGTIYGTTEFGGSPSGYGTAWSIKKIGSVWTYTQLYIFGSPGNIPHSGLILAHDGNLYGTGGGGGDFQSGVIYRLVPPPTNGGTWTYQLLHSFKGRDPNGDTPSADLLYANGKFYGANINGGDVVHCPDSPGGCGTVFQFSLPNAAHDFNGDGVSDILWHHTNGSVSTWQMAANGTHTAFSFGAVNNAWQIAGTTSLVASTGDVDGGGKSDIFWRHTNGSLSLWEMNGGTSHTPINLGTVATAWQIAGVGDFDGDGHADILWRHTNGSVSIWKMAANGSHTVLSLGTVATAWHIAGIGDINHDGRADIVWRHTNGSLTVWQMNGGTSHTVLNLGTVATAWAIAGVGDVDGDGNADIVWRHTNGSLSIWKMNGAAHTVLSLGTVATAWHIVSIGDYNKDGHADILWRHNNGSASIWKMNANGTHTPLSLGTVATAWTIVE